MGERPGIDDALWAAVEETKDKLRRAASLARLNRSESAGRDDMAYADRSTDPGDDRSR